MLIGAGDQDHSALFEPQVRRGAATPLIGCPRGRNELIKSQSTTLESKQGEKHDQQQRKVQAYTYLLTSHNNQTATLEEETQQ